MAGAALAPLAGQTKPAPPRASQTSQDDGQMKAEHVVVESMSQHRMRDSAHLSVTVRRAELPGDRARAAAIASTLGAALERFRDYHVALKNGYEIFMPEVPQPVFHFTNYMQGFAETFRFRADQATSLLYKKTKDGYELVGAMYTAPRDSSEMDLDARVPLSIAQWHAHVNICLPPRGAAATTDWKRFGPDGSIASEDGCRAAGGRFFPQLFGWMVHVYPFEKTLDKMFGMD